MYCPNCKIKFEGSGNYCPLCGGRLSADEHNYGYIVDDSVIEDRRTVKKRSVRFNFSKPLSLLFAAILIFTMFVPWFSFSGRVSILPLMTDKKVCIFELRTFARDTYDTVWKYVSPFADLTEEGQRIVNTAETALLLTTLYFAVCLCCFALFGLIGLFTKGRARYFFARIGSTMYFTGTLLIIAAGLIFKPELARIIADANSTSLISFSAGCELEPLLYAACAAAILFRTLGIRLLRYSNGISCLNRGDMRTAEREFSIIHCTKKLPRTFSKGKLRRGRRVYGEADRAHGYDQ